MSGSEPPSEFDKYKAETERLRVQLDHERLKLDQYRATHEANRPVVEGLFRFADLSVRSLLILNGGAALGLLTFAANNGKAGVVGSGSMAAGVWWFGAGAALSVMTAAFSYFAQVGYVQFVDEKGFSKLGTRLRRAAIIAGVASWIAFVVGMALCASRMDSLRPAMPAAVEPAKRT